MAWEFQALRLYQQLEKLHLSDSKPDALVDVALARLGYVREHSVLPNKDSLYLGALETLRTRLPKNECWSEVTLAMARWHEEQGAKYDRLAGDAWKWEKKIARDLCDEAIAKFPGSFGATNAANLKARLEEPAMSIQCEEAVVPNKWSRIAMTTTNAKKVWLRIVKDPIVEDPKNRVAHWFTPERDRDLQLLARRPLVEWVMEIPDDGDLSSHMAEVEVPMQAVGHYTIIACTSPDFRRRVDLISYASFWSTNLAMSDRYKATDLDLLVVDRSTGAPMPGVKAWAFVRNYEASGVDRFIGVADFLTGASGMVRTNLKGAQGQLIWSLSKGDDEFISGDRWVFTREMDDQSDTLRTFLFTDRAIYRPGQDVFFKGIVTVKSGKATRVKTGHKTMVKFFDVNGELVDSVSVTTDAFGSFHGTFKAPTGALTGSMRIEERHGSQGVQVEEYKRPTFEVIFDPIAGQPKLGQEVSVMGVAKSYAGVPLDGAEVRWTVKRGARMPWWCGWGWRGLPWGQETEIASGISNCDASGKFTATFLAQADRAFPSDADPTFFYTVEANATDITGETQRGSTSLNLGYRSIDIELDLRGSIDRNTTDSIGLRVLNLNGQEVDVPLDVRITRSQDPPTALRERIWERPDRFLISREEHASRFPQDVYDNENDPLTWPGQGVVLERNQHRANGRRLQLAEIRDWDVGSYLIEAEATDESGRKVKVRKHFTVYDITIQNTGFANEAFHVEQVNVTAEPGDKASFLLSSALPEAHVLMEIERDGAIVISRWFELNNGQQLVELPVLEGDRGGFFVHLLCVERGRAHRETITINVPWSNKDLRVEWMSFRDKLQPGDSEEWRLKINGPKGEKVASQLLAAMYDASLDHFVPHGWDMSIWPANHAQRGWSRTEPFGANSGQQIWREVKWVGDTTRTYPSIQLFNWSIGTQYWYLDGISIRGARAELALDEVQVMAGAPPAAMGDMAGKAKPEDPAKPPALERPTTNNEQQDRSLRTEFRETAFFFPDLLTDRDGSIVIRFKTPDALTRWKVLGLAHTKDLKLAQFTKETITQKPLMVVPNLPRFLRAGDRIAVTAKINLAEAGRAEGLATLALFDPFTNKSMDRAFGLGVNDQVFIASTGASAVVSWTLNVPEGVGVVSVRITAASKAGPQSTIVAADGEERALPVLTDKVLVTESLPLWTSKVGTKKFSLEKLKVNTSTTLRSQSLKLEYTPNPAWYAVQALPYLMEFPHDCAEQVFSRYYANRLAAHIVEERPVIKQVFEQWRNSSPSPREKGPGDEGAILSNLEKNTELKNILLAETPWVVNARNDRERKERIALLFDLERMGSEEATALKKLRDMQLPNGAWPWWSGMRESRWITQHIVAGLGHLEVLKAADLRENGEVQQMTRSALRWLDNEVDRDYNRLQRDLKREELEKWRPGYSEIHYLYARSFFRRWPIDGATNTAVQFYKQRLSKEWLSYGLQEQAMIALALHRLDDDATARLILTSIGQRSTNNEELGMYWKEFNGGMDWWSFPAETHALMIEAFHEVAKDGTSVNALRTHLLKLKQTTDWKTSKATAEACYALLLTGDEWLEPTALPVVKVGGEEVKGAKEEAGTSYFEKTWSASEIKPAMGEVTVTTTADKPSWGALHWQYLEQMDKVTPHESPFSIKKQVMLTEQTDKGQQLVQLDKARELKSGDLITIRIELRTDRPVDHVHLKDLRASGLEPNEAISGYKYQGGLGYYQSIRDASMNFFFDRIPAGTHVFEYTLRVTHAGEFSNGITTAMCMYAPEFSSHSEGMRVVVH